MLEIIRLIADIIIIIGAIYYFVNKKIQCFITSTEDLGIKGKKIIVDKGKVIVDE